MPVTGPGGTAPREVRVAPCAVLVVEDDAALRGLLIQVFQAEGHDVHAVGDGRQALHAVAQRSPDVIVLDRHLPVMDGEEFARIYRALPPPHAPLVLLTGHRHLAAAGARIGAAAAVAKPFDLDDLLATVGSVIRDRSVALAGGMPMRQPRRPAAPLGISLTRWVSWGDVAACGGVGVVLVWLLACALVSFPGVL